MTREFPILDPESARRSILRRQPWDSFEVPDEMLDRNERIFGERIGPDEGVRRILADVRTRGDAAVQDWTLKLDGVRVDDLRVDPESVLRSSAKVGPEVYDALVLAAERIERFHSRQPNQSWIQNDEEGTVGQLVRPIDRVGIYVPGGTAPLPSTLLMTAIPARVANVPEIIVVTPPQKETGLPSNVTLAAAAVARVDAVYTAGGAQAVAALAFGTETVPAVDKICGPGSLFVTLAKRQLFGLVGIDGLPGPTETVIVADGGADPEMAAADLLAQAEHDVLASAVLLTPSRALAKKVQAAVHAQLEELERASIAGATFARSAGIVVTETLPHAFALANEYAPEHLCLLVEDPWRWVDHVQNAGGLFLGERSFEVLGDYTAGPSHVMPTGGTARFASPVNVTDFSKLISIIGLNESALEKIGPAAETLARTEGLGGHASAVHRRLNTQSLREDQL
ncbi:MAG: histidinol dehydrogenase [Caldilineaceae bacterium]|nr:histidinol dehydrogenase [Caldilineaceae bacterium]MDE0180625.1 histidinol dehydrogenase [Caldilineaceae bacterium]MDE0429239.1 histidinol dehydrogenase [Caldilineaceae bacterium]